MEQTRTHTRIYIYIYIYQWRHVDVRVACSIHEYERECVPDKSQRIRARPTRPLYLFFPDSVCFCRNVSYVHEHVCVHIYIQLMHYTCFPHIHAFRSGCAGIFFTLFLLAETKKTDAEDAAAAAKDAIRMATLKRKVRTRRMMTMSNAMKKSTHRTGGVSDSGDVQTGRQKQHVVEIIDGGIEDDDESDDEL